MKFVFIFGIQINLEVFYKLILSFQVCIARHAQSTQNNIAYLCIISRKIWVMQLIFCLQINIKDFFKLILPKITSLLFLWNIIRNKSVRKSIFYMQISTCVTTAFLFYCDAKYSDILQESSHVRCYFVKFSLHARLNSHCKGWSYKKKRKNRMKRIQESWLERGLISFKP